MIAGLALCTVLAGADYASSRYALQRQRSAYETFPGGSPELASVARMGVCSAGEYLLRKHTGTRWFVRGINVTATAVAVGHNVRVGREPFRRINVQVQWRLTW